MVARKKLSVYAKESVSEMKLRRHQWPQQKFIKNFEKEKKN